MVTLTVALITGCSASKTEHGDYNSNSISSGNQPSSPDSQPFPFESPIPTPTPSPTPAMPVATATIEVNGHLIQIDDFNGDALHCDWYVSASPPIFSIYIEGKEHSFQAMLGNFTSNIFTGVPESFHFLSGDMNAQSTVFIRNTSDEQDSYNSSIESGSDCTFSLQEISDSVLGKFTCKNLLSKHDESSVDATGEFSCIGSRS
jgi:hypothetical protein